MAATASGSMASCLMSPAPPARTSAFNITLNDIDVSGRTSEVFLACIARKGCEICFVPEHLRCELFDRRAVMIDSWAFGYLDDGCKTEELLLDAMRESLVFDEFMLGEEWAGPVLSVSTLTDTSVVCCFGCQGQPQSVERGTPFRFAPFPNQHSVPISQTLNQNPPNASLNCLNGKIRQKLDPDSQNLDPDSTKT